MSALSDWPALAGGVPDAGTVPYERGIWGKVQGAASDFRWIARSAGFGESVRGLEHQLATGTEDRPARASFWRTLGNGPADRRYYATATYPSRARDSSGRTDFLEKQILEWRPPEAVPAALGALLLLPAARELTDEIWWAHCSDPRWADSSFSILIEDQPPAELSAAALAEVIEEGRRALRERFDEAALGRLYAQLLARHRPVLLRGLDEPLPAAALAALLLPLPRETADRLSLAGWIPASRGSLEDLGQLWDLVVAPPDFTPENTAPEPGATGHEDEGLFMARRLLEAGSPAERPAPPRQESAPPRPAVAPPAPPAVPPPSPRITVLQLPVRPGHRLTLTPLDENPPQLLAALYDFAVDVDRRWLDPKIFEGKVGQPPPPWTADSQYGISLRRLVNEVAGQRPSFADERQWQVKVDLLRSAALCLSPDPLTFAAVGLPVSGRVPSLLFAPLLPRRDSLWRLGNDNLRRVIRQSLACETDLLVRRVNELLTEWRRPSSGDQRRLLDEELMGPRVPA